MTALYDINSYIFFCRKFKARNLEFKYENEDEESSDNNDDNELIIGYKRVLSKDDDEPNQKTIKSRKII